MQDLDALPAWATRQRNRLLIRRNDQKIVRWINHRSPTRTSPDSTSSGEAADGNPDATATRNPVVHFAEGRTARRQ